MLLNFDKAAWDIRKFAQNDTETIIKLKKIKPDNIHKVHYIIFSGKLEKVINEKNKQYKLTLKSADGCMAIDSPYVYFNPPNTQDICIVGVDQNNKNVVVWEKSNISSVDSFFVYFEINQTDHYILAGKVFSGCGPLPVAA